MKQVFIDIRLRPGIATTLAVLTSWWWCSLHVLASHSLRPNVMSSIKPEVHNISQCRQRRIEPPRTKFREDQSSASRDMLADRQTDSHTASQTDGVITILCTHTKAD